MKSPESKALVDAAFAIVYTDEAKFIRTVASEYTLANMGKDIETFVDRWSKPETIVVSSYQQLNCEASSEGYPLDGEYNHWLKIAKKLTKQLNKAKLPLTVDNAHAAFDRTGPFAAVKTSA
jgi:hypothetical protein